MLFKTKSTVFGPLVTVSSENTQPRVGDRIDAEAESLRFYFICVMELGFVFYSLEFSHFVRIRFTHYIKYQLNYKYV